MFISHLLFTWGEELLVCMYARMQEARSQWIFPSQLPHFTSQDKASYTEPGIHQFGKSSSLASSKDAGASGSPALSLQACMLRSSCLTPVLGIWTGSSRLQNKYFTTTQLSSQHVWGKFPDDWVPTVPILSAMHLKWLLEKPSTIEDFCQTLLL